MFKLFKVALFIAAVHHTSTVDYCNPKMCPHQGKHIRCNNDGNFSKDCIGSYTLQDMRPFKNQILKEHHIYRNILASGSLQCFYPAARMPALKWDKQLAKNAEFNVKTCKFAHDRCRSTTDFPFAGQNIYSLRTMRLDIDIERYIDEAILLWFEEYLYANSSLMESFTSTTPQSGHFTLLMNDRNTHVGCAFLDNIQPGNVPRRFMIFTCNYSSANIQGLPSYKVGKAASRCSKTHYVYSSLCQDKHIDANDIYWYKISLKTSSQTSSVIESIALFR